MRLLEKMMENFDDGRSKSLHCRVAALPDSTSLEAAIDDATRKMRADPAKPNDAKARILKEILSETALRDRVAADRDRGTRRG